MSRPSIKLTSSRLLFLAELSRCKPPVSVGSAALEIGVSSAYVSQCLDVFVQLGLVSRHDSPEDRRIAVIKFTKQGIEILRQQRTPASA